MYKTVNPQANFPEIEEKILAFWKENKIFEKSLKKDSPKGDWTFLDGPPFITGMPHYGTLLSSLPKDVYGRYYTMKGYHVRRVWGWDGHGLPIENKVEGELEITRKKDIEEKTGVKKFIERCLYYVNQVSGEWEWYVDHIGRWVDFKNAYKTWDLTYMESVMWVFKQMFDKDYIYKGLRVSLFCPHCSTPISNFEVAMDSDNYKMLKDPSTIYKYPFVGEEKTFILAWSTTPWNKIVTPALAVNPDLTYVRAKQNEEIYILAKSTSKLLGKSSSYEIIEEFKGSDLLGKKFVPHYDYYKDKIEPRENAFVIIGGDFVTADEGTGIVTIAAYGEEDLKAMNGNRIHIETHLDEEGNIKEEVPKFAGMYYLKANKAVEEDLNKRNLIYKTKELEHSVPLCWRCHTRLYYAPINAWYVNVQILKEKMAKTNKDVNWFPNHFKNGRFLKSFENAPDWNISRNRYWGSPVPVWECICGEVFVPGSIKELEEASGKKIVNLHKPDIDEVEITCNNCGKKVKRVPEVLDSWIEAGSASFGERHYPFGSLRVNPSDVQNKPSEELESFYPPDFIAEYTGQIRAWFYVLHVIANALDLRSDGKNYLSKNVLVEGVILGTDGRKMSKNYNNYPDPKELIGKYGGDALRLYLLGSPVMHGKDIIISEEQYRGQVKGMMLILWNTYNFFVSYANVDGWQKSSSQALSENVLDKWILSLLNELISGVTADLDKFDSVSAIDKIGKFINEFSTWYIRRSRDRVGPSAEDKKDKNAFYETSYEVFTVLSKLLAPLAPFISEEIYKNLTGEESVHLTDWPSVDENLIDKKVEKEMFHARQIVELGHSLRKEANIKVRQPLKELRIKNLELRVREDILEIVKDELNIKEIFVEKGKGDLLIDLDTNIAPELRDEGEARDLVRKIQEERKKIGTKLDEKVNVSLPKWPKEFEEEIKRKALVNTLSQGEFSVSKT